MKINKLFLVLCVGLLAFASCKKEPAATVQPQTTNERNALAVRGNDGKLVNTMTPEEVQARIDECLATKDNNYVFESYKITEATAENGSILTISFYDVNAEESYNISFAGDFLEEISNTVYAKQSIVDGNFCMKLDDNTFAIIQNGEVVNITDDPTEMGPFLDWIAGWFVRCQSINCNAGTCEATWQGIHAVCSECAMSNPEAGFAQCTASSGNFWAAVGTAITLGATIWKLFHK